MLVSSNGIGNFYQQARDNIRLLAEGSNVLAVNVYNPTIDGGFFADAWNESLPSLMGYKQTVQVAIECELRAALAYNRELGEVHGGASPVLTQFVGHSQGTIHGNLAVDGLHAEEKERITVVNIGAASRHLPRGLIGFVSIVDKGDPVVRLTASHRIAGQVCEQERKGTYRLVETDISSTVGEANAGNQHSFYLYAQTEQFQRELAFVERPQPVVISRPFIPGFNWWANQLGRSYVRSANTPDRGGVR